MTTETITQTTAQGESWRGLRPASLGLLVGVSALGLMFHAEITAAVRVWTDSTAYNHCFLIIPIAAYLAWERRHRLAGLQAQPLPWAALLALPLTLVWLAAERLGIMEGRQLVVVTVLQVLVLGIFGWRIWWALLGPLLYLDFAVPSGEFFVPRLQDVTTAFVRDGLELLHVPAFVDGYVIEIPEGTFFIAEACAGLRFLIASVAFGCLYALLMYRTPVRRAAFIFASICIPIVANGFRALGVVVLGHLLGSTQAAAADHVVYGWIFFSLVILLLTLAGLPFRQDDPTESTRVHTSKPVPDQRLGIALAAIVTIAVAAIGPAAAAALDRNAASGLAEPQALALAPTCQTISATTEPAPRAQGRVLVQRAVCGTQALEFRVAIFAPRSTAAPVLAARRLLTHVESGDEALVNTIQGIGDTPPRWRMVQVSDPAFLIASALWIDGLPAEAGLATRLRMAWESVMGGGRGAVVVAVTPSLDWRSTTSAAQHDAAAALSAFLQEDAVIGHAAGALLRR